MAKTGRPTKLTKQVQEDVCLAISIGATYEAAARYAGITYRLFRLWMTTGEEEAKRLEDDPEAVPDPEKKHYLHFFHAVQDEIAGLQIKDLNVIEAAAAKDPNWAWRRLQYRFPKDFAPRQVLEHTGKDGGPIKTEDTTLTDEERLKRLAAIFERAKKRVGDVSNSGT